MIWLKDNKVLVDQNGSPFDCYRCPCDFCGRLETRGWYDISVSVSHSIQSEQFYVVPDTPWGDETYGFMENCSATFQGRLTAKGFVKNGSDKCLKTVGTPTGSRRNYAYMGSDVVTDTTISGYGVTSVCNDCTDCGMWLIIHCADQDNGSPRAQMLIGDLQNCVEKDYWGYQYQTETLYIFPNNYYTNSFFDENKTILTPRAGFSTYLLQQTTLSKHVQQITETKKYIVNTQVTINYTYIPNPQEDNAVQQEYPQGMM